MNVQTVNVMKILVAVIQLLSEDVWTDRQTERQTDRHGELEFLSFEIYHREIVKNYFSCCESHCCTANHNIIIQNALIITAAPVNPPAVPKSQYYHTQSTTNYCSSCQSPCRTKFKHYHTQSGNKYCSSCQSPCRTQVTTLS